MAETSQPVRHTLTLVPLTFAALFKQYRLGVGLSQVRLATATNFTVATIRAIEQGRRTPPQTTFDILANALRLPPDKRARLEAAWRRARERPTAGVQPSSRLFGSSRPCDVALLPAPERFVGRQADLAWVEQRLRAGGATAITAIAGLGGIGKTALAAVAVRHLYNDEHRFQDGIAVVNCLGRTDAVELLRDALVRFAPRATPRDLATAGELATAALRFLRDRDVLVVFDNVEPAVDIPTLLDPLTAAAVTVLLTARSLLPVPPNGRRELALLSAADALDVFAQSYGRGIADDLAAAERIAATRIVTALDCHTLAVKLAGAEAADLKRPLAAFATELEAHPLRVQGPTGQRAVADSLQRSIDQLSPPTQKVFAALAIFATPEFGRQAATAVAASLAITHPEDHLDLLVRRAVLTKTIDDTLPEQADSERLRLHPLLRALAEGLFHQWPTAEQDTATLAVAQYFATYAEARQTDSAVLAADEGNLTGALEWAQAHRQAVLVGDLTHGLRQFWIRRGRFREGVRYLAWGVAAVEAGLPLGERREARGQTAELNLAYGHLLNLIGQPEASATAVQRSLEGFRRVQDRRGEGAALSALGDAALSQGQVEAAEAFVQQSLAIAREIGDRQGAGEVLSLLGQLALYRGQYEAAEAFVQQSLAIAREIGDRQSEAVNLNLLGQQALWRGQYEVAETSLQQSLAIARETGDRQGEGRDLNLLGWVALRRGQYEATEAFVQQSLAIAREIGDRQGEGRDLNLLGQQALWRGQYEVAETSLQQSLAIAREIDSPRLEARALRYLGQAAESQVDLDRAETLYRSGLAVATEREAGPEVAEAQLALGRLLAERLDRCEEGCALLLEAAQRFVEMGMPEAEEAREVVERLGCAEEAF